MSEIFTTIYLIGPRGAGKTSVGRQLARKLGCAFKDADALICAEAGRTVAEIVDEEDWEGFRQREARVLLEASATPCVLATGGGAVLLEANRLHMRRSGLVFYLSAPADALHERLARNPNELQRPSLTGQGLLEEIESVLAEREPLYRATAHHCLDASAPLPEVVASILQTLKRMRGKNL